MGSAADRTAVLDAYSATIYKKRTFEFQLNAFFRSDMNMNVLNVTNVNNVRRDKITYQLINQNSIALYQRLHDASCKQHREQDINA
jgi:hypothetical protein